MNRLMKSLTPLVIAALTAVSLQAQEATVTPSETLPVPSFPDAVESDGEVLVVYGRVLDINGEPVEGALVEIWQTDAHSIYDHPNIGGMGMDTSQMDTNFQHFGAFVTEADGVYAFRTIIPASEGIGRPLHIHVKVKLDEQELLTTQIYFEQDGDALEQDQFFAESGDESETLIMTITEAEVAEGETPFWIGIHDIVVNTGATAGATPLTLTAAQTEGPFYPVVVVADFDNDLTVVSEQANPANVSEVAAVPAFTLINLNTATPDELFTIPDMSNRMVHEFEEYRPYVSIQQFRREIGKYVDEAQVAAYEAYVYVPVSVNDSDAETLMQLPGVDETIASALMAGRPYASNEAFLTALAGLVSATDAAAAAPYLASE